MGHPSIEREKMKERIEITCDECGAVYNIEHDLDPDVYDPKCCTFCHADLEPEHVERFIFDEEDDEWIEKV